MARDLDLRVVLSAVDRVSQPLRQIGAAVGRVSRQTGLDRVASASADVGRGLGRVGREAARFARTAIVIGSVAGGALFGLATRTAALGDATAKTADKLGLGIEELQELRYHFELAGVATSTTDMALQRFTRRAAEAAAGTGEAKTALEYLGIQLQDSQGKMRPTGDLMADVADALTGIEDESLRVRIAFKLFDSGGVALVNGLKNGSGAMRESAAEAQRLGIITEEQARAAERFTDSQTRLTRAVSHVGHAIGADLLPIIEPWIRQLGELAVAARPHIIEGFRTALDDLGATVTWLRKTWSAATEGLSGWVKGILTAVPALAALAAPIIAMMQRIGLLRVGLRALAGVIAVVLGAKLLAAIGALFGSLVRLAWAVGATTIKLTLLATTGAVRALGALARSTGLAAAATRVWNVVLKANPILLIVSLVLLLAGAVVWLYRNWDGVVEWMRGVWAGIKAAVDIDGLLAYLQGMDLLATVRSWFSGVAGVARAAWEGITGLFSAPALADFDLLATVRSWFSGVADVARAAWEGITGLFSAPALADFDLLATVRSWFSGVADVARAAWEGITGLFSAPALADFDLLATVRSWFSGVADVARAAWEGITGLFSAPALADFDLLAAVRSWFSGVAGVARAAWEGITGLFSAPALADFDLLAAVRSWFSGVAGVARAAWEGITGLFSAPALADFDLLATVRSWFSGVAGVARAAWEGITGLFSAPALADFDLLAAVRSWFSGVAGVARAAWEGITGLFSAPALADFDLLATVRSWFSGVAGVARAAWEGITGLFSAPALADFDLLATVRSTLGSIDWIALGTGWISDLWGGISAAWGDMMKWLGTKVADLLEVLPGGDWVAERLGIDVEGLRNFAEESGGSAAPDATPTPTFGAAARVVVGGEVRIRFEDAPRSLRIGRVRSDNPDIPIDVSADYAMGAA